jgi:hypothetical protein
MFKRRVAGEAGPWTEDPILREFKFCNVFRAADRVSQYMIRDVCYHDESCTDEVRLFQITAFRTFSIRLFFPPKWGINDHLPEQPILDNRQDRHAQEALF